jgi:hypothetical protein
MASQVLEDCSFRQEVEVVDRDSTRPVHQDQDLLETQCLAWEAVAR